MKNNKGSVPAFLTLGLVLIGSLVTIGISFLTNNNKIASNPRAGTDAGYCCVKYKDGKNYGCPGKSAIQNVGKYCPNTEGYTTCGGYSSCNSLYVGGNIDSSGTCESYEAQELTSQGTMCADGGGGTSCKYADEGKCWSAGCPKGPPSKCSKEGCTTGYKCTVALSSSANCVPTDCWTKFNKTVANLSSDVKISTDDTIPAFYTSEKCADDTDVASLEALKQYCIKESAALAAVTCSKNLSCDDAGYTPSNGNNYALSEKNGVTTYYLGTKGASCSGTPATTDEKKLKSYCTKDPNADAEAKATCNKDRLCTSLPGISKDDITNKSAKASYKIVDGDNYYYESTDCSGTKSSDIVSYCNEQPGPPAAPPNVHDNVTYTGDPRYAYCDIAGRKKYAETDLPDFVKQCESKHAALNECYQVIISDIGWNITADYMNCCYKECP